MQSPNIAKLSEKLHQSETLTEKEEIDLFRDPLFRVVSNLQHDKRVCEEKWNKPFNISLDFVAHVVAECPSLFIPSKSGSSGQTAAANSDPEVSVHQGYGLTCLLMNHLLQILTHPADDTITTKTRGLFPAILNLLRLADPITFRKLLSELIFCLGDLTQIHESFFQGVDTSYRAEMKRFQIPSPSSPDESDEVQVEKHLKKRSVVLCDPASCECLQANICEVLLKMVMDLSRLSLDSGCYSDTRSPELLWACLGCQIENGEIPVKKVSLRLVTSLLKHCDLPRGQVQNYLVNLLVELVNMLCAGFNSAQGDYVGLEETLALCVETLVARSDVRGIRRSQREALRTGLFTGLLTALTDHGLHRLRTAVLPNTVCAVLARLVATSPEDLRLHNEQLADRCGELARTLVEEVGEVGQRASGIVLCLRELILLELLPASPSSDGSAPTDPDPKPEPEKPPSRKRKLSNSTQSAALAKAVKIDLRLSRTLHHVVSKIGKLSAKYDQEDFPVDTVEGALCGIWLLLETVVQCVAARPSTITHNPAAATGAGPNADLAAWLGASCVADLCALWWRVLRRLSLLVTPAEGAGDAEPPSGTNLQLVSGVYRAIVRSIGALVSVKDVANLSSNVYTSFTSLLTLHWMPNEMSWQDLKPANRTQVAGVAGALADVIDDSTLAEAISVLALLPKDSAAKWRIHVLKDASGSTSAAVCAAVVAGFPFLLYHCGPNTNHLVYDLLHEVLKKRESLVLTEMAAVIGPLACVVSRKAVLHRVLPDAPMKLSYQNIFIQCVSCDNLPASEQTEGPRDRPKIVDPNMFQPFLALLKTPDTDIKLKVISNLCRLFGHISVRSNNAATVSMMGACLQLIEDPQHKVRLAFSDVVGCFVGTDPGDKASETDQRLITALKTAASKAEKDGHVAVVETVLITLGQLGRKVTSDLFFVIIVSFLDCICHPFSPLTSSVAKTQLKQLAAYKGMEMKELFVQYGRNISKILADYCLVTVKKDKCDPLVLVDEISDLFGFDSSKAFLRHTERYMLPHLVLKATPHASYLIRAIAKALGDPNHKNPLARNIDAIFSELAITAQVNELMQAFEFLEAESEWDLPTLLRLGQHVDSELLLHLSTNYSQVLAGIKIYLTKLMFTQKSKLTDEEAVDMLQPKLLGILVHFDNHLNNGTIPLHEKRQVFESAILLMKLMGPKHITSVRVRLMTTLRIGMEFGMKDPAFQELCCRAWNCFVHSIDVSALGPMLAQIVVSLQPLLKIFPKQVAPILDYLIVENRKALEHHFHELYFVPEIPELGDVNAVLHKYIHGSKSNSGLEQQVAQLLKGISHESQDVRALALTKLRSLLRSHHEQLHRLIGATETAGPITSDLITALLAGCRDSDQTIRILFGECLGELGAIDPGRLELMSSASKDELAKFPWSVTEDLFAVDLINTLAKAFLRAEDRRQQDCVAFSIQELIRAYEIRPGNNPSSSGERLWSRFSEEVQEIMEPLTRSKYSLNFMHDWSSLQKPIYKGRKGSNFNLWVTTLTGYFISKVTQMKAKQVFDTCRAVVKTDQHLALYLLPYVAVQVLLDGSQKDHTELKEEIMAVLKHAEERETRHGHTSDRRYMCAQTVFSLLDHFTKWKRHRVMVLSARADAASRTKSSASAIEKVREDEAYRAVDSFLDQIQQDVLASASFNCGAYSRALMHIEQFIKPNPERLSEHLDFLQKLYVELNEPDGVTGITAIKHTRPTLSEQILAYQSTGQLSDASVCYDQVIQQEPANLSYRQGLLHCRLALGELQSAMDLANGMISDRPVWAASLNAYRVEAAWKLGQWDRLGTFLKAEGKSSGWTVGLGKVLYAVKTRDEPAFIANLRRLRDDLMTPLSAASMEVGSYHRGYEYIVRLHMLNELEQGVKCLLHFPRDPPGGLTDSSTSGSHQMEPLTIEQLKSQWESRLQFTQSAFRTQEPILTLRRTLLNLGREERNLPMDKNIGQCWLQTAKVARECGLLQTAHSSLVSASAYDLPGMSVERAKWLWDRGDYDMAQSCLEKALEQHYPRRSELKPDDASWVREDRFQCAQMLLLLSQYCEETASMESNAIVKHYREVHKIHNDWEDGYFFVAKYYDKIMTKLIPSDRPEKKGDFIVLVLQYFGQSLVYGNQYIYESMPRMLSLWLDYGAEVAECEVKSKNEVALQGMRALLVHLNKMMANYTNKLAPYQFLTAFPQLTSRICHANADVFSQLRDLIAKLIVVFPQQTMWMMMAVSKSSYQIRMKRCQEIFNSAKLLNSDLNKFLLDATKLTDRLLDLCNRPCEASLSTLSIKQHFKPLQRLLNDSRFSHILLPLQSLMTVSLPSSTVGATDHDPFPMNQVYIKDIEDTVEILPSLQRPKKITMRGSDGKLYIMLCKPKDDLRKDARLMEFNTIINKFLRKNFESRRRDLHIRTYTVTPLNEECGLLEWVSNTAGFRNILNKLYKERGLYTTGKELRTMALPSNAPLQKKQEMYKNRLLPRHPAVFSDWFLRTFPDPTSWYNARLSYARTTAVMSIVGYILGLGDRHGENILFDSTNGDVVHVDFNCLFNKGETFDFPEIVPFRLTHNMVEAMGPTGYEGVCRRACEVTLRVMRNQSDPLMSVLKTFIYDPLVEWSKPAKGRSESGEIKNEKAYSHVSNIESRLKGVLKNKTKPRGLPLSVEGHVNHLIKEATDENNLCQMYIGWAAYM